MRILLVVAALLTAALPARAGEVVSIFGGANGIWYDGRSFPNDFELGGNAVASLSPHISAVGSLYYGFDHSYLRGSAGARITATDVEDRNFSIGLGLQYQASSEADIRPQEWAPDVSMGWKPWPDRLPKVILAAQGSYGLTSKAAFVLLGARYFFSTF